MNLNFATYRECSSTENAKAENSKSNNATFGKILSPLYSLISPLLLHPASPSLLLSNGLLLLKYLFKPARGTKTGRR